MIKDFNIDEVKSIEERLLRLIDLKEHEEIVSLKEKIFSFINFKMNINDAINTYIEFLEKNDINYSNIFSKVLLEYIEKHKYLSVDIYERLKKSMSQEEIDRDLLYSICEYYNSKFNVNCKILDLSEIYTSDIEIIPEFAMEKETLVEFVGYKPEEIEDDEDRTTVFYDAVQGDGIIMKCEAISYEYRDLLDKLLENHIRSSAVVSETYYDNNEIFTLQISDDYFFNEVQIPFLIILIISLFEGGN